MQQICRAVFFPNGDVIQVARMSGLYDVRTLDKQDKQLNSRIFMTLDATDKSVTSSYGY